MRRRRGSAVRPHLRVLGTAYRYLNWWLDGQPGAMLARQGFYMSAPTAVQASLSADEWDYWYGGKPAARDLPGVDGRTVVRSGASRPGGAYWQRAEHISVWNTTMDEYNYLARHWSTFAASFVDP